MFTNLRVLLPVCRSLNFRQLLHAQIGKDWGHEVSGVVMSYNWNVLIDSIFIEFQNRLSRYQHSFHCPTLVQCLGLYCQERYMKGN